MFVETTAQRKIEAMTKRIRGVRGGTSAGKTLGIEVLLTALAQWDKKPTLTSVVSETLPHLKRGAIRDFLSVLQEHEYYEDNRWNRSDLIYTFETGSQLEFFSADQADKVRGPRRDRLFLNEANNISFEAADQLIVRTKEFIIADWNPTAEFWIDTEVKGRRDDYEEIVLTYKDNEALDPRIVKEIEMHKDSKWWWQVYGLGQYGEMGKQIYKDWKLDLDEIPHAARLMCYGLDFGYTNDPSALVAIYYLDGVYIIEELLFQKGLSNKQIADFLSGLPQAVVVADSAEPKSIDELRLYGISVVATTKGKGSVMQRIQITQDQRISATKQSVNVIKEYRNYMWLTDRNGQILNEPDHMFSHSMDAVSYAIQFLLARPGKIGVKRIREPYETSSFSQPDVPAQTLVRREMMRPANRYKQPGYETPGLG